MESINYLDFELRIEKRGQRYLATVVHSPCGEATALFRLPFSKLEIENFVLRMENAHRGMRRITTPEMQTVRQFGNKLFEAVFSDEVRACFISSQNEAKNRGSGLRLKLRLEAPELINIPWEFLYDASLGRFLGLFEDTPIVRYIEVRERVQALAVKPPLSILVMIANPSDYPPLDIKREKENLQEALRDLIQAGILAVTWVEKATLPALAETLLRKQFHIFHYIGHGGFAEQSNDGILVLEDEGGKGQWVSGERLAYLLGNQPTLRLVILFAGIAMTLVRTGSVPAVVAMQLAITDVAAIAFGRGFFTALSVGKPVDAAVTQARLAIFASGNDVEWGTPVLYMRSQDGRIFDIQTLTPQVPEAQPGAATTTPEEVDRTERRQAEQAQAKAQIWQEQEAARKAEEERQAWLSAQYRQVLSWLDDKNWVEAVELLEKILTMQPGYLNAAELLVRAKEEQERADRQAVELHRQQEAARQRQERLTQSYAHAIELFQAQRWAEAIQEFQLVFDMDPNFSDGQHGCASDMLARARLEKERSEMPPPKARFARPLTLPEAIPTRGKPKDLPK
jgi:tetratricopeptide (TPR) repeat protein